MAGGAEPAARALPELLGALPARPRGPDRFGIFNALQNNPMGEAPCTSAAATPATGTTFSLSFRSPPESVLRAASSSEASPCCFQRRLTARRSRTQAKER